MAFLNDLDAFAWAATIVALVVVCILTFVNIQDWRDHQKIEIDDDRLVFIIFLGAAFIVGAFSSYSPNANAPRKTVEGIARYVAESHSRRGYTEYICATSCQLTGGFALALHDKAARVTHLGSSYAFTYLEHPVGGAFTGISLRVIAISEPDSGVALYALDLTNHPYRIALYLLDTALLVSVGLLGGLLNRSQRHGHSAERMSDDEEEEEPRGSGPISLGLESKDAD